MTRLADQMAGCPCGRTVFEWSWVLSCGKHGARPVMVVRKLAGASLQYVHRDVTWQQQPEYGAHNRSLVANDIEQDVMAWSN